MTDRDARLNALLERQSLSAEQLGLAADDGLLTASHEMNIPTEVGNIELHRFNFESPKLNDIAGISELEALDEDIFAKWRIADMPVMFAAGFLGTLSSVLLRDFFASFHDNKWYRKSALEGGHSGENVDWVPGKKQSGGFGHRWEHGHDLANPFEIDWSQYKELAEKSGTRLPLWLKGAFYWVRHLFQDSFSKQGLPVPGHSMLRDSLSPAKNDELLKFLGTIKARDCVGTAVTNVIMTGYLWGTEKSLKRVYAEPNYRAFSLMLGANVVNLLCGLLAPPPYTSLNWSTIPIIGYYSWQLVKLEKKVQEALEKRERALEKNDRILKENAKALLGNDGLIESFGAHLDSLEKEVNEYYQLTMANHEVLKRRILKGA
jgi:hypothetical protein